MPFNSLFMTCIFICFIRQLRTLFLEESTIDEKDGHWLHEIAVNNSVLEHLNFYTTYLSKVSFEDLELIARNCPNLTSVKISDFEILDLVGFFRAAAVLEEFCGGSFNEQADRYNVVAFPRRLCSLGLTYMGRSEMPIVFPFALLLKKLDLLYALLDTEDHCSLIQRCPNLEVLEVKSENLVCRHYFAALFPWNCNSCNFFWSGYSFWGFK